MTPTLLALLLACSRSPSTPTPADGTSVVDAGSRPDDPTQLGVAIVARARDGGIPTELAVNLSLPVLPKSSVNGPPPEGTKLTVTPATEGELVVTDRDTLVFRPAAPLRPATDYTVTLDAIGGDEGEWRKSWSPATHSFTTPAFGFLYAGLRKWERGAPVAEVTLVFAGPVDADDVARRLELTLAGHSVMPVEVGPGDAPEVVRVVVRDAALTRSDADERALGVKIAAGVPMVGLDGVAAPAGESSVDFVFNTAPVKVLAVKLHEGQRGFYWDVICDDGAVDEKRWWWDRENWDDYQVSSRCELDQESARESIHLSPDVPFSIGPADGGFRVFADLPFGSAQLRIDSGARTVDGGALTQAWEGQFDVPHRKPKVRFASPGRYLPRSAWDDLALHHTNVSAVDVTIRHVPEENLVFWMSGEEPTSERTADLVARKRVALRAKPDVEGTTWVDVGAMVPEARSGLYELEVTEVPPEEIANPSPAEEEEVEEDPDTGYRPHRSGWRPTARAVSRLVLTDMHLVAKVAEPTAEAPWSPEVRVWAVDVQDNDAVSGVELTLVRPSGKAVARCTTGSDGSCALELKRDPLEEAAPIAILARKGQDLTYLKFADLQVRPEGDVTGAPYRVETPWRAAVWTDRGVYRPGDVAHVAGLLRTDAHVAPTESVPTLVKLFDPQGKELRRVVASTNEAGLLATDLRFSDYATTGRYRVAVETGGVEAGIATFNVEEFVPERLRVGLTPAAKGWLATDEKAFTLQADWLFGGALKDARAELDCRIEPTEFTVKALAGFRFGPLPAGEDDDGAAPIPLGAASGATDEAGAAALTCPASPAAGGLRGPGLLVARATVFEGDSGRTSVREERVPVHPDRRYVGLASDVTRGEGGRPIPVSGVVADWAGKVVPGGAVSLELYELQEEMGWVYDRASGSSRFRRVLRRVKLDAATATASDGRFAHTFTPRTTAAGWLVVATAGRSRTELKIDGAGRRWWWSSLDEDVDHTPRPGRPTRLALGAPELSRVGDRVTATFTAPYPGRVLWTLETDRVVRSSWATASAGENTWTFPIEAFEPDYYVSALLLKDPHLESPETFLPDRAFGVARVRVEPTKYTVPLKVVVPAEARPNAPLEVVVEAQGLTEPTFVTVAAVDEGILSLTRFADPDPARAIFAPRALGVSSYETVGWTLLHEPAGAGRRTGGDAAGGMGRVQMVKPVALWSGIVPFGRDGRAKITFDVPSYRGSLRVMAVAAGATRMGHAAASVPVREPLTLTTTVPRFLLVGDRAQVPVQLTNLSGAPVEAVVRMNVRDAGGAGAKTYVDVAGAPAALGFGGAQQGTLKLAAGASGTLVFQLAANTLGAARVEVTASAGKLTSTEGYDVPVLSPFPEVRMTELVQLREGENDLAAALRGWEPGSDRTTVWVTRNPYAQALTHLKALIHYPYGCIEQTTSSTRPLLYVRNLLESAAPEIVAERKVEQMIQAGVDRVASMQTPSGGFAYWPGGREPVLWGTAYGAHMLLDAKAEGFPVPEAVLANALGWLERQLDRTYGVNLEELAYAHYVLARAGRPHAAQARKALESIDQVTNRGWQGEARVLLQAAIQLSGDRRHEAALKGLAPHAVTFDRTTGRTYWSDLRSEGVKLSVYRDLFGAGGAGDALAASVAGALGARSASSWYTTQELAWGITGLGKSVSPKLGPIATPALSVNGRAVEPAARPGSASPDWTFGLARAAGRSVRLNLPDDGGATVYALVTTTGHRVDASGLWGESGLSLGRAWRTGDGEVLDPDEVPLGEAFYVVLTLENRTGRRVENLALVDRVPAGWEIENPRLGRGGMPGFVDADGLWAMDHMNIRDDRLEVFGALERGQKVEVVYQVRAVTAGAWSMPETQVEAMYDPTLWARVDGGPVRVVGQWAGFLL